MKNQLDEVVTQWKMANKAQLRPTMYIFGVTGVTGAKECNSQQLVQHELGLGCILLLSFLNGVNGNIIKGC